MTKAEQALGALISPYGGTLIDGVVPEKDREARLKEAGESPKLSPFIDFVYDAEKIANGAYSPLDGFMDSQTLRSVLETDRLPGGLPWTIPIVLTAGADSVKGVRPGDSVALHDWEGTPFATVQVSELYPFPKKEFALGTYGTAETTHPNVNDVFQSYGDTAIAGKVQLLRKLKLPTVGDEMSPKETRELFASKGWKNVVAYQCRNPPHTAHEYIQKVSMENPGMDGLLVQPVIGRLKKGDYRPTVIMEAYRQVIKNYYPNDLVVLSSLSITMRYAGPKAALFLAIVRRNFGAGHYIVGRDQAGVGGLYEPYACHEIFDRLDIGVVPLKYKETFYCRVCKSMATARTCPHPKEDHVSISQTKMRELLKEGKDLPTEILRPEVISILRKGDVVID